MFELPCDPVYQVERSDQSDQMKQTALQSRPLRGHSNPEQPAHWEGHRRVLSVNEPAAEMQELACALAPFVAQSDGTRRRQRSTTLKPRRS